MKIGKLGSVTFQTSSDKVLTFDNFERSGSASIQSHDIHNGRSLTEFTGVDSQKLSFDIVLSRYLGVSPSTLQKELFTYCRQGKILKLTINGTQIGTYRWLISDWKSKYTTFGKNGKVMSITMSISLVEYLKQPKTSVKKATTTTKKKTTTTKTTKTTKKTTETTKTYKVGDVVSFKGGYHYVSSTATSHSGKCAAGPAKIYAIAKGAKHPYCLIHTNSKSTVYGWVDASTFS